MSFRQILSKNPFTQEIQREVKFISNANLKQVLDNSHNSFKQYRQLNYKDRADRLECLANNIDQNVQFYAEILAQEMGKPIKQGKGEVVKSAGHCRYYAKNMERFLKQQRVKTEATNSGVIYQPLGSIYLMIPFNFPFWLTFKAGVPILSAGNTIVMRNSDSTPILGEELEKLFRKSGFDNDEFQNVYTKPDQLEQVLQHKGIQGLSFTGSSNAGRNIASLAGQYLKKPLLELGGSDPFIVCHDADIELAVQQAVSSRLLNNGQVCISAKRFMIHESIYDKFQERLIELVQEQKQGNPLDESTQIGPMARNDLKLTIQDQVQRGLESGATLLYENDCSELGENFYGPVVVEIQDKNNLLFQEETFGPVFALYKFKSESEAVELANESEYALGGAVFSKDFKRGESIARQLDSGMVFVNSMTKSDTRLPSGGNKSSGYGRECADFGIKEFTNIKSYYIA